jgi:arginine exporter protein ArgO
MWGLFLGTFIWLGSLSIGITGATSFILGAVGGAAIFLFVLAYGGDEPKAQTARRERAR